MSKNKHIKSDLKLGQTGKLNGVEIEIIGVIVYRVYDEGWYYWEEWYAAGKNSKSYWINYEHDTRKFSYFESLKLTSPLDTSQIRAGRTIDLGNQGKFRVSEQNKASVVFHNGRIPWNIKTGEKINYADGMRAGTKYSIEWTDKEIEIFKGKPIPARKLYKALSINYEQSRVAKQIRQAQITGMVILLIFFCFMCWLCVMAINGDLNSSGAFIGGGYSGGK